MPEEMDESLEEEIIKNIPERVSKMQVGRRHY